MLTTPSPVEEVLSNYSTTFPLLHFITETPRKVDTVVADRMGRKTAAAGAQEGTPKRAEREVGAETGMVLPEAKMVAREGRTTTRDGLAGTRAFLR